jgi:hypothetical protein
MSHDPDGVQPVRPCWFGRALSAKAADRAALWRRISPRQSSERWLIIDAAWDVIAIFPCAVQPRCRLAPSKDTIVGRDCSGFRGVMISIGARLWPRVHQFNATAPSLRQSGDQLSDRSTRASRRLNPIKDVAVPLRDQPKFTMENNLFRLPYRIRVSTRRL